MKKKIKLTLVKDAKYKMKQSIKLSKKTEHIKIEKSEGRILSKNIIAKILTFQKKITLLLMDMQ